MPTHGFSTKPLKAKLLAGEQKATEFSLAGERATSDTHPHDPGCAWKQWFGLGGFHTKGGAETWIFFFSHSSEVVVRFQVLIKNGPTWSSGFYQIFMSVLPSVVQQHFPYNSHLYIDKV